MYTTTGTPEKVNFLMEEFGLPRDRIGHSRSTSFVDTILKHTKGKGSIGALDYVAIADYK